MEMQITISGVGVALGNTGFGVNALTGAYIEIRRSKHFGPCKLALAKAGGLGSDTGSIVLGHVQTDWFQVNEDLHPWLASLENLVGKTGQVEVTGALIAGGRVDIQFDVISDQGDIKSLRSKANIKSSGLQLSSTKVRGIIRRMPGGSCAAA